MQIPSSWPRTRKNKGNFIVFEGIDNSGKTTIAKIIKDWLMKELKIETILTRHPGSTEIGQEIRQILKHSPHPINPNAQALLFAADNSLFTHQLLIPSLRKGYWVIGDRDNFISSLAYQIASGCSIDEMLKIHAATLRPDEGMIDVLFIFHCSWEETRRRKNLTTQTKPDRYEDAGREYFNKLVHCYEHLNEQEEFDLSSYVRDTENIYYIDVEKPIDDIVDEIKKCLKAYIISSRNSKKDKNVDKVDSVDVKTATLS